MKVKKTLITPEQLPSWSRLFQLVRFLVLNHQDAPHLARSVLEVADAFEPLASWFHRVLPVSASHFAGINARTSGIRPTKTRDRSARRFGRTD